MWLGKLMGERMDRFEGREKLGVASGIRRAERREEREQVGLGACRGLVESDAGNLMKVRNRGAGGGCGLEGLGESCGR